MEINKTERDIAYLRKIEKLNYTSNSYVIGLYSLLYDYKNFFKMR